jgi:hypothetical protein
MKKGFFEEEKKKREFEAGGSAIFHAGLVQNRAVS